MKFQNHFFRSVFFVLLFILSGQFLRAQNETQLIFKTPEVIELKDQALFTVVLQIENQSQDTINARLHLNFPSTIRSYSQDNLIIKVNPSKKAFIPLKFLVNKQQAAGKIDLDFNLIDFKTNKNLGHSITKVNIESRKNLKIFPQQPIIFYRQEGDSIRYELKVMNMGNQPEKILLTNVLPDFRGNFTAINQRVEVKAFEEKTVKFSKYVDREMMKVEAFQANVSAYFENGDFAGNVFYSIQNVSSNRVFIDPTTNQSWLNRSSNYVRFTARDITAQNPNYNVMAHQDFSVGLNEFAYNVNVNSWNGNQETTLTDSWIKYQYKKKGVLLGAINNNDFDLPINGRGLMLFNNLDQNNQRILVGFAEKNYNLLDELTANSLKNNYTTFANSRFLIKGKNELESTVLFDQNFSSTNFILTNGYKWITPNKWNHAVKLGYGFSKFRENKQIENSMSISANVSGQIGKYSFYSSNYFSSGYYPGTRKGALYLNQRVQRTFSKTSWWTAFTLTDNNPQSIDPYLTLYTNSNQSQALRAETGFSFKVAKQFNFSISPKVNFEKSNVMNNESFTLTPVHFQSTYLNSSFSWLSNSKVHQIVFNALGGFSTMNEQNDLNALFYGQLTWNFKHFQLNSSYQKGSSMIAEVYSSANLDHQIERFNSSISYRQSFFNNRLNTSLNSFFSADKNFGNIYTIGATAEYQPLDNLLINLQANHSQFDAKSMYTKQTYVQVGVQYNLPAKQQPSDIKTGTINLFVFYDYNANGIFDEGDKAADNRIVKINNTNFITDLEGKIKYRKVPFGDYHIQLPGQKWYAEEMQFSLNESNVTLNIPMQLTGVVRGKVEYEDPTKLAYQVSANLYGFTLIFTHENGQVTRVKTNDRGEYSAFLPVGNYTFKIAEKSLPEHVSAEVYLNKVTIEQEKNTVFPPLLLKIKERKVNIKRFGN